MKGDGNRDVAARIGVHEYHGSGDVIGGEDSANDKAASLYGEPMVTVIAMEVVVKDS